MKREKEKRDACTGRNDLIFLNDFRFDSPKFVKLPSIIVHTPRNLYLSSNESVSGLSNERNRGRVFTFATCEDSLRFLPFTSFLTHLASSRSEDGRYSLETSSSYYSTL